LGTLSPKSILVWEAENGDEAFERLTQNPVDVLFLDVEFPPKGAFHLLERTRSQGLCLPKIVFVTGHDDFALQAFDWAACDYVLKPLTAARVREALERVRRSLISPDIEALLMAVKGVSRDASPERFTVSIRDRILIFRWSEVQYLTTELRQVYAQTTRGKVPVDHPLDELEGVLQDRFVRIHRSSLINLDFLVEVQNPASRAGQAIMQDGTHLSVSRCRMDVLLGRLRHMR
jgi:two-component system LytT family response regulator